MKYSRCLAFVFAFTSATPVLNRTLSDDVTSISLTSEETGIPTDVVNIQNQERVALFVRFYDQVAQLKKIMRSIFYLCNITQPPPDCMVFLFQTSITLGRWSYHTYVLYKDIRKEFNGNPARYIARFLEKTGVVDVIDVTDSSFSISEGPNVFEVVFEYISSTHLTISSYVKGPEICNEIDCSATLDVYENNGKMSYKQRA